MRMWKLSMLREIVGGRGNEGGVRITVIIIIIIPRDKSNHRNTLS